MSVDEIFDLTAGAYFLSIIDYTYADSRQNVLIALTI